MLRLHKRDGAIPTIGMQWMLFMYHSIQLEISMQQSIPAVHLALAVSYAGLREAQQLIFFFLTYTDSVYKTYG